jgi:hypothetical protein
MATLKNPQLAITTRPAHDAATVVGSVDVSFTTFEVNTMNKLGLRYRLQCDLLDMDVLYPDTVIRFEQVSLPRTPGEATTLEHVEFVTDAKMSDLHMYVFGKDPLYARFVLTNEETGAEVMDHSEVVRVDLAA